MSGPFSVLEGLDKEKFEKELEEKERLIGKGGCGPL